MCNAGQKMHPLPFRCDGLERLRSRGCCPKERHQSLCRASSEMLSGEGGDLSVQNWWEVCGTSIGY